MHITLFSWWAQENLIFIGFTNFSSLLLFARFIVCIKFSCSPPSQNSSYFCCLHGKLWFRDLSFFRTFSPSLLLLHSIYLDIVLPFKFCVFYCCLFANSSPLYIQPFLFLSCLLHSSSHLPFRNVTMQITYVKKIETWSWWVNCTVSLQQISLELTLIVRGLLICGTICWPG